MLFCQWKQSYATLTDLCKEITQMILSAFFAVPLISSKKNWYLISSIMNQAVIPQDEKVSQCERDQKL